MALQFERVKEGNLITAKLMNDILTALENLEAKIGSGTNSPGFLSITSVSPDPVEIGKELTVEGVNLGKPGENMVILGGTQIDAEDINVNSDNTQLTFKVPDIELPADGKVWLTIFNPSVLGIGYEKIKITRPAVETKGSIEATVTITKSAALSPWEGGSIGVFYPEMSQTQREGIACNYLSSALSVTVDHEHSLTFKKCDLHVDNGVFTAIIVYTRELMAPGNHLVAALLPGFTSSSQYVNVVAGQKASLSLTMTEQTFQFEPPDLTVPDLGEWIGPGWYDTIEPFYELVRWPWPPPEERFGFDPVTDPMPEVAEKWLERAADRIQREYPDAPVDRNIQIFVDRSYAPGTVTDQAYAYVVFGDSGAYMPVVLISRDITDAASVPLVKGEVAGIDAAVANQLASYGIKTTAQLASAWTGVVQNALKTTSAVAQNTIKAAQVVSKELQGSLLALGGVSASVAKALSDNKMGTYVALANAEPQDVSTKAGIESSFAERLVIEARAKVSESAWSLTQLGLNESQINALEARNITTLQSFKNASTSVIAGALGITQEQVGSMASSIDLETTQAAYTRSVRESAPVTNVFGINREIGVKLAQMGFATVGALATADKTKIASAFAESDIRAEAAVSEARKIVNRT